MMMMSLLMTMTVTLVAGHGHGEGEGDHHSVLCRSCGREVADPWQLRVSPLSPHTLATHNVSMFGSSLAVPVERLRNPAGYEFSVITFSKGSGFRLPCYRFTFYS